MPLKIFLKELLIGSVFLKLFLVKYLYKLMLKNLSFESSFVFLEDLYYCRVKLQ